MPDAQTDFTKNLPSKIESDPDTARSVNAVFLFKITGDGGGTWTVDLKGDAPGVKEGEAGTADCTLEVSAEDWKTISDDPTKAMPLFFQGKLKVTGNAMLATQLQKLLG
jgi:putative sterol carrier protein